MGGGMTDWAAEITITLMVQMMAAGRLELFEVPYPSDAQKGSAMTDLVDRIAEMHRVEVDWEFLDGRLCVRRVAGAGEKESITTEHTEHTEGDGLVAETVEDGARDWIDLSDDEIQEMIDSADVVPGGSCVFTRRDAVACEVLRAVMGSRVPGMVWEHAYAQSPEADRAELELRVEDDLCGITVRITDKLLAKLDGLPLSSPAGDEVEEGEVRGDQGSGIGDEGGREDRTAPRGGEYGHPETDA